MKQHNYFGIDATIIADSINQGQRLTTYIVTFPRIVLAEFNTHRMLSKNSASSRAIPYTKMLRNVQENPFIPIKWMKEHTGMQGTEYFINRPQGDESDEIYVERLTNEWLAARDVAVDSANILSKLGVTKQITNRLLEPFLWHTVIVTGTEWENFFALRAHPQAEIHIQDLAHKMLYSYNNNKPVELKAGEWHIPFGDRIDLPSPIPIDAGYTLEEGVAIRKVKIATARCARVSYMTFDGEINYDKDIQLHDTLLSSGHMSPFEHCAKAMSEDEYDLWTNGKLHKFEGLFGEVVRNDGWTEGWCGNFRGFIQYRKLIPEENKSDSRVNK